MVRRMCPLRSTNEYEVDCIPQTCAWYNEEARDCEMILISSALRDIKDRLDNLDLA